MTEPTLRTSHLFTLSLTVDPSQYYFRTTPWFETSSEKYRFLNRIVSVATGRRDPSGPVYDVFQVL